MGARARKARQHAAHRATLLLGGMPIGDFTRLAWVAPEGGPVIGPPLGSPIIADPTFLPPHDTPDGRWHLLAHSIWGVHHFVGDDGVRWSRPRLVVRHAMRPFLLRDRDAYHLFYERYPALRLPLSWFPGLGWRSWIERRSSTDLVRWGPARQVLAPGLHWHRAAGRGEAVGNPCVVAVAGGFTLYYGASLVRVPDCGFDEPLHIGVARAGTLDGPWRPDSEPVISPRPSDPRCNLGAGAIKVLRLDDGFVGLHNGIALDAGGASHSAISVMTSQDGSAWRYAHAHPIVAPTSGWRARFVYACDVHRDPASGQWRLYFNARDRAPMLAGREAIGFVVAG
jgi:hypothetical protein